MNFESGLINRKQNSHCHMSYSSHNYWFRRDLNVLVGNTRTSFIFLKIFVKNSVKVRHSQQRFRKKKKYRSRRENRKWRDISYLPRSARATGSERRGELGNKYSLSNTLCHSFFLSYCRMGPLLSIAYCYFRMVNKRYTATAVSDRAEA